MTLYSFWRRRAALEGRLGEGSAAGTLHDVSRQQRRNLDGLEPFMPRIRHAFVIGQASEQFATWLDAHGVPYTLCGDLETAVPAATTLARAEGLSGATVLLSPACASWDQFKSFEHRGDVFAALVHTVIDGAVLEQKDVSP